MTALTSAAEAQRLPFGPRRSKSDVQDQLCCETGNLRGNPHHNGCVRSHANLHERFERGTAPLQHILYRIACQLTPTHADAEDLLQDTMIKAYNGFESFNSGPHLQAWLIRIMRNVWIDNHRRSSRRPVECLTGDVAAWERDAYDRNATGGNDAVADQFSESPLTAEVRRSVQELPENLARAMHYAYIEGLTYKEIAELEGIPVGTVMSRLHRARHQLRVLLTERLPFTLKADSA